MFEELFNLVPAIPRVGQVDDDGDDRNLADGIAITIEIYIVLLIGVAVVVALVAIVVGIFVIHNVLTPVRWISFLNGFGFFGETPSFLQIDIIGYLNRFIHQMGRDLNNGEESELWDILFYPVNSFIFNFSMSYLQNGLLLNALFFTIWPEWYLEEDVSQLDVSELNVPKAGYPAMVAELSNLAQQMFFNQEAINEKLPFGINAMSFVLLWAYTWGLWLIQGVLAVLYVPWVVSSFFYVPIALIVELIEGSSTNHSGIPLDYSYYCHSLGEYLPIYGADGALAACPSA